MSNYCTAEDVQVLLGFASAFSTTSVPTLTQVNSIISDVTNEIDFTLASVGITTQPTDTRLLGRLHIACKYGVACQVGNGCAADAFPDLVPDGAGSLALRCQGKAQQNKPNCTHSFLQHDLHPLK